MPLGRLRVPFSWRGMPILDTFTGGTSGGQSITPVTPGPGSRGARYRGLAAKLNAPVRSPVTRRRQALRFGTSTPNRVSMKRRVDVWSNTSELTSPPREHGETTMIGTRKPSPIGPRLRSAADGRVAAVRNCPLLRFGGGG